MTKQVINVGTAANDGTGDTLRAAAQKINSNFTEVYGTAQAAFDRANTGGGNASTANVAFMGTSLYIADGATETEMNISPNGEGWAYLQLPTNATANISDTRLHNDAGNVQISTGDFSTGSTSYNWNFNGDGSLKLPQEGTIKNHTVNLVGSNYSQLQWTTANGVTEAVPNDTQEPLHWLYVDHSGINMEVNINNPSGNIGGLYLQSSNGKLKGTDTNGTPTILVEGSLDVTRNIVSTFEYANSTPQMAHNAICVSIENGILYSYSVGFGTSPNYYSEQRTNVLLTKTDYKGNFVWQLLYDLSSDGDLDLYGDAMSVVSDGTNVLICGSATPYGGGTAVGFLLKVDTSGNIVSTKLLSAGAGQNFIAVDAKMLSDGSSAVTGYIENGLETWLTGITPSTGSQVDMIVFPRGDIPRDLIFNDSYIKAVGADTTSTDMQIGGWINGTVQTITGDASGAVVIASVDYRNGVYTWSGATSYGSGYDVYGRYKIAGSLLGGVDGGYELSATVSNATANVYQFLSADYPTLGATVQVGWYAGINSGGTNTIKTSKITAINEADGVVTITTELDIGATGNVDFFSGNDVTFRNLLNWGALYQWADVIGAACTDYIPARNVGSNIDFSTNAPYNIIKVTYTDAVVHTDSWTKTYNGNDYDNFKAIVVDSSDNVYTCGYISTIDGHNTGIITKINPSGDIVWTIRPYDIGGDTNRSQWNQYIRMELEPNLNVLYAFGTNNWGELIILKVNPDTGEILASKHLANLNGYVMGSSMDEYSNLYVLLDNNRTLIKFDTNLNLLWQRNLVGPSYIGWQYSWSGYNNLAVFGSVVFQCGIYNNKSIVITYPSDGSLIGQGDDWYWHNTSGQGTWENTTVTSTLANLDILTPTITVANPQWPPVVIGTTASTLYPLTSIGLHGGVGGEITGVKDIVFEDGSVLSTAGVPDSVYVSPGNGITHTITTYNGGTQFDYTGSQIRWFDPTNVSLVKQHGHLTGYIVEYQAYDSQSYGVVIGTIHYSSFYGWQSGQEATHTEHMSSDRSNINNNKFWVTDGNSALAFLSDNRNTTITIQWTAKLFWGEENNC